MLSLGYYANQISVHFKLESIVAHAGLYHYHKVGPNKPVPMKDVIKTADFLHSIFRNEFIPTEQLFGTETEAGVAKILK